MNKDTGFFYSWSSGSSVCFGALYDPFPCCWWDNSFSTSNNFLACSPSGVSSRTRSLEHCITPRTPPAYTPITMLTDGWWMVDGDRWWWTIGEKERSKHTTIDDDGRRDHDGPCDDHHTTCHTRHTIDHFIHNNNIKNNVSHTLRVPEKMHSYQPPPALQSLNTQMTNTNLTNNYCPTKHTHTYELPQSIALWECTGAVSGASSGSPRCWMRGDHRCHRR